VLLTFQDIIMLKLREYTIQDIQDEVQALITKGAISHQQYLYELAKFFGYREWQEIERLLESHDYLLRDNIIDLVGKECWLND
jgi:Domain of unknown function (DUF4327)